VSGTEQQVPAEQQPAPSTTPGAAGYQPSTQQPINLPLKDLRVESSVLGSKTAQGTVEIEKLVAATGTGGVKITLESSNPEVVKVPSQVTVTQGTSVNFSITTRAVSIWTPVNITARLGGQTKQAEIKIQPPWVEHVQMEVPGFCKGDAKVAFQLAGPAPKEGIKVKVQMGRASPPTETVMVSSGKKSGTARMHMTGCPVSSGDGCHLGASATALQSNGYTSYPPSAENQQAIGWCATSGAPQADNNNNTDREQKGWDLKSKKKM
jgi:hypothetical protein